MACILRYNLHHPTVRSGLASVVSALHLELRLGSESFGEATAVGCEEIEEATAVKRRMLKLKAKLEGDSSYYRFPRLVPGYFNQGMMGSIAPPYCSTGTPPRSGASGLLLLLHSSRSGQRS